MRIKSTFLLLLCLYRDTAERWKENQMTVERRVEAKEIHIYRYYLVNIIFFQLLARRLISIPKKKSKIHSLFAVESEQSKNERAFQSINFVILKIQNVNSLSYSDTCLLS